MDYKCVNFQITCHETLTQIAKDLLMAALGDIGFESFEETENGIQGYIPSDIFETESITTAIENFLLEQVSITYQVSEIKDKNWNETWENAGFTPITIDNQVVVYDAKSTFTPMQDNKIYIAIEAKQAFGTGTHQTTRLVISLLLHTPIKGKRMLDCGCGTGILSITASLLGAKEIVSYDIDEWSINNTQHNAMLNKVDNIETFLGNAHVLSHVSGMFDVVVANINRNVLLNDMPHFVELMNTNAHLILSGFYESDAQLLIDQANILGLTEIDRKVEQDWCCLVFSKD